MLFLLASVWDQVQALSKEQTKKEDTFIFRLPKRIAAFQLGQRQKSKMLNPEVQANAVTYRVRHLQHPINFHDHTKIRNLSYLTLHVSFHFLLFWHFRGAYWWKHFCRQEFMHLIPICFATIIPGVWRRRQFQD